MTSKQFNNLFSSSVPKMHRPVGASPAEGQQVDHRDGALFIWEKTEKIGFFQPGKKKALGCSTCGLPVPERLRKTIYKGM